MRYTRFAFSILTLLVAAATNAAPLAPPTANLKLWASADTLNAKDGVAVSLWRDLSGGDNHLTSAGDGCPTYVAHGPGGRPTVHFDGNNDPKTRVNQYVSFPLTGEWNAVTIFAAGRNFNGAGWVDTDHGIGTIRSLGALQLTGDALDLPDFAPSPVDPSKADVVAISAWYDEAGSMHFANYQNGVLIKEKIDPAAIWGVCFNTGRFGDENLSEISWKGDLSEALIYRAKLSEAERQSVERYLMVKYGIQPAAPGETIVTAVPLPSPVTGQPPAESELPSPSRAGLTLWARPESLPQGDGSLVTRWPDSSGAGHDLISVSASPATVKLDAINHWPTAVFGQGAQSRDSHSYLTIPLAGAYKQVSIIFVGNGFAGGGLLDTDPESQSTLRSLGPLQFTGGELSIGSPFPIIGWIPDRQMIEIDAAISASSGTISTYLNGCFQRSETASAAHLRQPLIFSSGRIGDQNHGEQIYKGDISEVMIYDHVLSAAERASTTAYLTRKYNLLTVTPEIAAQARSPFSLTVAHLPSQQSWIGNSFPGKVPSDGSMVYDYVQSGIAGMTVAPDGTVIASSIWDEPHKEIGFYKDGKPLPIGRSGGTAAIYSDGTYLYAGSSGMSKPQTGLRRYTMDLKDAPWPGQKAGDTLWFTTTDKWQEMTGLVALGDSLYLTYMGSNDIHVVGKATGAVERTIPMPAQPTRLAASPAGTLWVALPDQMVEIKPDGSTTGRKVTGIVPGAVTVNGAGHVLVAENGDRQQVVVYDVSGEQPKEIGAIGIRGGVWAGPRPGAMGPTRLFDINELGTDSSGNIYMCLAGHQLRAFSPTGQQLWSIEDTCFCTVGDIDPASNGNDYYTGVDHYTYKPGQPAGKDWVWTGITYDNAKYPELGEGSNAFVMTRRINGHLLRYSVGGGLVVHRQLPGSEIFAPCAAYASVANSEGPRVKAGPASGRYVWNDLNDDGKAAGDEISLADPKAPANQPSYNIFVDSKGGIWEPEDRYGIRYMPLKGFTAAGSPIYDLKAQFWLKRPKEFSEVFRAYYYPESDTMYLSGLTYDNPAIGNETWGGCGRECIRYSDWSKPTRHIASRMVFPRAAWTIIAMGISTSAHRLFAGEVGTAVLFCYDTDTGKMLGCVEQNVGLFGVNGGWIDQGGGVRVFTRSNGEIIALAEDSYLEKTVVYRIPAGGG